MTPTLSRSAIERPNFAATAAQSKWAAASANPFAPAAQDNALSTRSGSNAPSVEAGCAVAPLLRLTMTSGCAALLLVIAWVRKRGGHA